MTNTSSVGLYRLLTVAPSSVSLFISSENEWYSSDVLLLSCSSIIITHSLSSWTSSGQVFDHWINSLLTSVSSFTVHFLFSTRFSFLMNTCVVIELWNNYLIIFNASLKCQDLHCICSLFLINHFSQYMLQFVFMCCQQFTVY